MEYNRLVGRTDRVPPDSQSFQLNVGNAVHWTTGLWGIRA